MRKFEIVSVLMLLAGGLVQTAGAITINPYGVTNYVGTSPTPVITSNLDGSTTYTYTTSLLDSLAHGDFYTWGIASPTLGANDVIVSATLSFTNIYDWIKETTDILYVHLLDNPKYGIYSGTDGTDQNPTPGDQFSGQGLNLGSWQDIKWQVTNGPASTYTAKFDIDLLTLAEYMSTPTNRPIFGFGIDPDCHFYDSGVIFTLVTTDPDSKVPEPVSMLLFGTGLVGLAGFQLRRKAKN